MRETQVKGQRFAFAPTACCPFDKALSLRRRINRAALQMLAPIQHHADSCLPTERVVWPRRRRYGCPASLAMDGMTRGRALLALGLRNWNAIDVPLR